MKKLLTILILLITTVCFAQKREIVSYAGIAIYQGNSYQFKFTMPLYKEIDLQTGLRFNNEIDWKHIGKTENNSMQLTEGFQKNLLDISLRFSPVETNKFALHLGGGFTTGKSTHYANIAGSDYLEIDPQKPKEEWITKVMWNYNVVEQIDYGYHFFIQSNYKLKHNLFLSGQILYSQLTSQHYEDLGIPIEGTVNLSLGLGYQF